MKRFTPIRILVAFAALALLTTTGCGNPCTEFTEASCSRAGETSPTCTALRERSDKVSSADKRDCTLALKAFGDLAPTQR
ncbi:MAG: hypothetical protein ACI9MR_001277 [Myxococcota bacterium]|jgi:hypothetical protein